VLINAVDHMELAKVLARSERTVQPNPEVVGLDGANLLTI
jgi:hypothetical protein